MVDAVDARLRESVARWKVPPSEKAEARARLARALGHEPLPARGQRRAWSHAMVAAAILVLLAGAFWVVRWQPTDQGPAALRPVQFVLADPTARSVVLVGDFNRWDPAAAPLIRERDGVWSVVVPLRPGTYSYSFVVDGREWRADPAAPPAPDDYGRPSSVTYITQESTQ